MNGPFISYKTIAVSRTQVSSNVFRHDIVGVSLIGHSKSLVGDSARVDPLQELGFQKNELLFISLDPRRKYAQ